MREHKLPLRPSHKDGKHQFPPTNQQIDKHQGVWWKCEPTVSLCLCISSQYLPSLQDLSKSGVSSQGVSFFLWKTGFLAIEMALVLSHMRGAQRSLQSLMPCTIHRIWEQRLQTQTLWWIEQLKIAFEKTSKQEKIHENDKYQKCSFGQSHNQQNHHQKSQQDQAKKKRNTKSQT
jgi:hypothetical protein